VPTLTLNFPAGTTGTVEFICPFYLFDSVGNEIAAPFSELVTVNSTVETVDLLSGVDPDVTPNPWSYTVKINLNGANEFVAYAEMPLTNADFMDIFNPTQPVTPEYYVLKSDFLNHVDAIGSPVSEGDVDAAIEDHNVDPTAHADLLAGFAEQTDIDDAISAHEAAINPHPTYLTQAEADALYEDAGAVTAHAGATDPHGDRAYTDSELTAHEAALDPHPGYLTPAEGNAAYEPAGAVATHVGLADPHTQYTLSTELVAHEAAADPHTGYLKESDAATTYAPLADPALTGNPTAPNRTTGDNDTSIANTAFVQTAAGLLVPKSLFTAKGVLAIATAADTPAAHAAPTTGQFLVGNTANSDGWENRVLAFSDLPTFPKGSMSSASTSIADSTDTILGTANGLTNSQTHAFHSDSTNRSRMTIPSGQSGDYLVSLAINLGTNDAGARRARLLLNGSTLVTLISPDAPAGIAPLETTMFLAQGLVAGDYLEIQAWQSSGSAQNMTMSVFGLIRIP
jgi:hypothetical protein